jgi:hypothetical protein
LGAVGEGLLRSGVGKEAGDEVVGEVAEGEVDLGLKQGEGSGVTRQLFGPKGLLVGEAGMDLFQSLGRGGDSGAGLRVEAEVHEKSFLSSRHLLSSDRIDYQAASGSPFWERTPEG